MEIYELLTKAYSEVEKSEIPEEFRVKAFEKSIDLIAGLQSTSFKTRSESPSSIAPSQTNDGESDSVITKIARELEIEPLVLEEVYYMNQDDDEFNIIVGSSKLDDAVASATREIALLTAGGRQLGGIEDWTSAELIREKCEYFNKYDSTNFAKTIKRMDDVFSFMGSGQKREVKINRPGIEKLEQLIKELTSQNGN